MATAQARGLPPYVDRVPRPDRKHDLIVGQYGGYRQNASTERLAQDQDVRAHVLVVTGQHFPGAAKPVWISSAMNRARLFRSMLLPSEGNLHPARQRRPRLDRLDQEACHVLILQGHGQRISIVIRDDDKARI